MKIIDTRGKFEGCFEFIPFFWDLVLKGFSDDFIVDSNDIYISFFDLEPYREKYNIPKNFEQLEIWEDEYGFIHSFLLEHKVCSM